MASNHTLERGENISSEELLLEFSQALDLGAEFYRRIERARKAAITVMPEISASLDFTDMELGGVLVNIASLIADKDDVESVRAELQKRGVGDII